MSTFCESCGRESLVGTLEPICDNAACPMRAPGMAVPQEPCPVTLEIPGQAPVIEIARFAARIGCTVSWDPDHNRALLEPDDLDPLEGMPEC